MNFELELLDKFEIEEHLLPVSTDEEERMKQFRVLLIRRIDELIRTNFEQLKCILYRIDVNENKLKEALQNSEADAPTIMADMIIARQMDKAASRKKFGGIENDWSFEV